MYVFVCLLVFLGLFTKIFHSFGDFAITGVGLNNLHVTFARPSRHLNVESSLMCHTYCKTGQPFIMIISEDPWHSHQSPNVWPNHDLPQAKRRLYLFVTAAVSCMSMLINTCVFQKAARCFIIACCHIRKLSFIWRGEKAKTLFQTDE